MKFIASKKRFIVAMLLSLMVAIVGGLVFADDQAAPQSAPTATTAAAAPAPAPALQPDPSGREHRWRRGHCRRLGRRTHGG